jgi:PAS domain S-box-containing protein
MDNSNACAPDFLHGGGQTGELMRRYDWASSPLGLPHTWPPALRTAVSLMLGARQPVYIAWGPELISLYNDGYLSIVGDKHPGGFGTPFRELWAEIWDEFRPIVEATMAGQAQHFVDLPIALAGRPGLPVGWFTFSYTALRDEGGIRGFYCAATETTEQVLTEDRQRFLFKVSEETRRLADPEAILDAASLALGEQLRAMRVTYSDIDEACGIARPRGNWTDGTVVSLPPEIPLEDFRPMVAMLRSGATLRVTDAQQDPRFESISGALQAAGIAAMVAVPLLKDSRFVASLAVHDRMRRTWTDAEVAMIEAVADYTWSALERAQVEQALRKSDMRQRFLLALSDAIRPHSEPVKVKEAASHVLGEELGANRVFYAEIRGNDWMVVKGYEHEAPAIPDGPYAADTYGHWIMDTYRAGRRIVFHDTRSDPRFSPVEREAHAAIGIIGAIGVPLVKQGRLVAILAVHTTGPREWAEHEIALVEETAERTWAAVERARAEDALRESERLLQKAVSVGTVGVLFFDLRGRVLDANPALQQMSGYTAEELRGMSDWGQLTPPEFRDATRRATDELANGGVTHPYEKQWLRPDGSRWWGLFAPTRLAGSGPDSQCVEFIIDITASKQAEAALREADERKDEFLAMLAHELRNPLAPIRTAAQVLKLAGSAEPRVLQSSGIIERQVEHMTKIVDDLLDVSRVTRGLVQLVRAPVELREVIAAAIEQCRSLIEARRHRLALTLPPEPLLTTGDVVRLVQVVTNLLGNAAKYSDPDAEIAIQLETQADEVVIRLRDHGIGISPELLPHVFDLFTQADRTAARSQGGLGLGLALVKRLVELHDGSVEARSDGLGRGAEFIVRLPLLAAGERAAVIAPAPVEPATRIGLPDVLVVDDNKDAADGLALLLELEGHRVHVAYDGHSALECAQRENPSVMVLDIGLPGMDGYELARQLRAHPHTTSTTLIALSGYGQDADRRRAREAGFDHHLVKPVDPQELCDVLGGLRRS